MCLLTKKISMIRCLEGWSTCDIKMFYSWFASGCVLVNVRNVHNAKLSPTMLCLSMPLIWKMPLAYKLLFNNHCNHKLNIPPFLINKITYCNWYLYVYTLILFSFQYERNKFVSKTLSCCNFPKCNMLNGIPKHKYKSTLAP